MHLTMVKTTVLLNISHVSEFLIALKGSLTIILVLLVFLCDFSSDPFDFSSLKKRDKQVAH